MKLTFNKILIASALAFALPAIASAATMSVSPASQTVKVGDVFTVAIKLDTQGAKIDGVDIHYLSFNPALLQVVDANASTEGIQITPESLMALTVSNKVDNKIGQVAFSQVAAGGTKYSGSGNLAVVQFRAMAPGTAALTFGYTAHSTTDCNVASAGSDILTAVINGSYTITKNSNGPATPPAGTNPSTNPSNPTNGTTNGAQNTPAGTNNNGGTVDDGSNGGDTSADGGFQYQAKKSFWQTIWSLIAETFSSLWTRILHIFGK
jgi:hypothetical protein